MHPNRDVCSLSVVRRCRHEIARHGPKQSTDVLAAQQRLTTPNGSFIALCATVGGQAIKGSSPHGLHHQSQRNCAHRRRSHGAKAQRSGVDLRATFPAAIASHSTEQDSISARTCSFAGTTTAWKSPETSRRRSTSPTREHGRHQDSHPAASLSARRRPEADARYADGVDRPLRLPLRLSSGYFAGLIQQSACSFQIGRLEAFGETGVGFGQSVQRVRPALLAAKAGKRRLRSQPPGQRSLLFGQRDRGRKTGFRRLQVSAARLEFTAQAQKFRPVESFACRLDAGDRLVQDLASPPADWPNAANPCDSSEMKAEAYSS